MLKSERSLIKALCCDRSKVTSQLVSFQLKTFLSIEFVFWFWENQKGKLEIFGEGCCSTTFEAAALAQYWGETAISSCCSFWNSQKLKTIKGSFFHLVFKTKPITQQSNIFILIAAPLSDFNLFDLSNDTKTSEVTKCSFPLWWLKLAKSN